MALETIINQKDYEILGRRETRMEEELITPHELKEKYPLNNGAEKTVFDSRRDIANILTGHDNRFLVLVGPCSIDNLDAAIEYSSKLEKLREEVKDKTYLVMRTYFEKPRTNIGWKGLINDPARNETYEFKKGLEISRKLLIDLTQMGIPCATEFLDPFVNLYISDVISYGAIGARNSQSQTNWEFASDLSMPIGLKNSTDGDIQIAVNALIAVNNPHTYFGMSENGRIVQKESHGNKYGHVILRGGNQGPNYSQQHINQTLELLEKNNLLKAIIVDCSHANSQKDHTKQPDIAKIVAQQRKENPYIKGIMIESYLADGKGDTYGQSKTDACLGWEKTEKTIREIYNLL